MIGLDSSPGPKELQAIGHPCLAQVNVEFGMPTEQRAQAKRVGEDEGAYGVRSWGVGVTFGRSRDLSQHGYRAESSYQPLTGPIGLTGSGHHC